MKWLLPTKLKMALFVPMVLTVAASNGCLLVEHQLEPPRMEAFSLKELDWPELTCDTLFPEALTSYRVLFGAALVRMVAGKPELPDETLISLLLASMVLTLLVLYLALAVASVLGRKFARRQVLLS